MFGALLLPTVGLLDDRAEKVVTCSGVSNLILEAGLG